MKILSLWFFMCSIPCYLYGCNGESQLLQSVSGEVGAGNYTYYNLMYTGPISLYLYSRIGDADLYVSQLVTKPTFDIDGYCLQSATCGLDFVDIPASFQRPISIGVYGHPSHEISIYLLEAVYRENTEYFDGDSYFIDPLSDSVDPRSDDSFNNPNKDDDIESFLGSFLWTLVNVLLEILFL